MAQQYQRPELHTEAQVLVERAKAVDQIVQRALNKAPLPRKNRTCRQIADEFDADLIVSEEMLFLMQNHFVTIGKVYQLDGEGREIAARIDLPVLKNRLGGKRFRNQDALNGMICKAQTVLGIASIAYIQKEAALVGLSTQLSSEEQQDISEETKGLHARCTAAFFEMKTILLRGQSQRRLFLLKQHVQGKEIPFGVFYRSDGNGGPFFPLTAAEVSEVDTSEPVFVIPGVTPHQTVDALKARISAVGFTEMCLTNAACIPQYGHRSMTALPKVPAARAEVELFRERGRKLGCSIENPTLFGIVHTYPNTVGRELPKIRTVEEK